MSVLKQALRLLGAVLSVCSVCAVSGGWRFSNPKPHGNNILDLGLNDGVVWQIGDRGQVYTSRDLDTWIPRDSGTTKSLRSIAFFQGKAFISAEAGTILSASSQDDFTSIALGTEDWLEGIANSGSMLVAVGDNGAIYSSPNGVNWTRRGNFTTWLRSVAFGNNSFVAVGEDGFLATSPDGQTWEKRTIPTSAHLNKVNYINDRFWVVGDGGAVLTSNIRSTFIPVNVGVTNALFTIAGNTNEAVIAGEGIVLLGNLASGNWTPQTDATSSLLAPIWPYYSALWDGRLFLLGGRTGMQVEGFRTNSTAPMQWYSDIQPTRHWLWSATRATDFYAACGVDGTVVTSPDGIEWFREVVPAAAESEVLLGIGGNTNALIAVGSGGIILRAPNFVTNTISTNASGQIVTNQSSLFGVIWEQANSPTSSDLQAVAASRDLFVVGGAGGAVFTSGNGLSWVPRASGVTNFLSSAVRWPQGWILTGAAGAILSSADAFQWTRRNSGVSEWVYSVRHVGGKLIAVGEGGLILTSDNGVNWTRRTSGTSEWLNDVTFAQGAWYIAGSSGLILSSTDAISWSTAQSPTSKSLYAAVTDGSQLIMAGLEGVILRKRLLPVTTPVNFLSIGTTATDVLFLFEGPPDQRFVLEESVDLTGNWSKIDTLEITSSGGTLIYPEPQTGSRLKFFRTRLVAP